MELKRIDLETANVFTREVYGRCYHLLKQFLDSDMDYAEVVYNDDDYSSAESCASVLRTAAKRFNMPQIKVARRRMNVYLIRKLEPEKK